MQNRVLGWLTALLLCALLPLAAMAEGLELAEPISGTQYYPQGASPEQAAYLFRYEYPQFQAKVATDEEINAYFRALGEDLGTVIIPQNVEEMLALRDPEAPPYYTALQYQVTANTDAYLSVKLTSTQFLGYTESESVQAHVFARDGVYAGQVVGLSQVMGLEQEGDEFDSEVSYASQLVYGLVWQIMQQEQSSQQRDFIDGLTQRELEAVFAPETDFYLDFDGNLVFFIQAGTIAGEVEGVLTYPFSMAEVLTAVKP